MAASTVPYFITPCGPIYEQNRTYVNASQTINVTFAGTPPYNLTRTYYSSGIGQCANGMPGINGTYVLNSSTYEWTVESPFTTYGRPVMGPGDGLVFVAVEQQSTPDNASNHYYYSSSNYTVYDSAHPDGVKEGGSVKTTLKAGLLMGLLGVPAVLSLCL